MFSDEYDHAWGDGGGTADADRLTRQTPLAKEVAGPEHSHHGFPPALRDRQGDAAPLNVQDILTSVPLREDGLSSPTLHDGGRSSRRVEKRLHVKSRDGSPPSMGGLFTFHPRSMPLD